MSVRTPRDSEYIIAYLQSPDGCSIQHESISVYKDECIAIAQGITTQPYCSEAAIFTSETALWCYKHVRQRPFYWEDKAKLLQRIFRTSNLALWQKKKDPMYREGIAATLLVAILGVQKIWIGSIGNGVAYFIREGLIEEISQSEIAVSSKTPQTLGVVRSGLNLRTTSETVLPGDMLIVATDGVNNFITEDDLRCAFDIAATTQESCMRSAIFLLEKSVERGSVSCKTVCIIRKV